MCMCVCWNTEIRLTYGIGGERVVLQVLIPFTELLLHSVHERFLWCQTHLAGTTFMSLGASVQEKLHYSTHRVIQGVDPGWPWGQTGWVKLPLIWMTEPALQQFISKMWCLCISIQIILQIWTNIHNDLCLDVTTSNMNMLTFWTLVLKKYMF